MSKVNEPRFLVQLYSYACKCWLNKTYLTQSKHETMMNIDVNVKNCKSEIRERVIVSAIKHMELVII